ncbi:hypothetical protein M6B38_323810 [Iris pallida]|uniref:Uncharacterized protein n=1 Tax=Iris pallida TaxID=29817 RepID=A0AAX6EWI6_IRIPA|nr:hypothetical protein M6B38_166850 [Iris pallida]KAJ6837082.1 hypothetical protein M6B38_323810 [Iris pallida]
MGSCPVMRRVRVTLVGGELGLGLTKGRGLLFFPFFTNCNSDGCKLLSWVVYIFWAYLCI